MSQISALVSMMRTFGSSLIDQQVVDGIAFDEAFVAPVIGKPDLVNGAAFHPQRPHAPRHQHPRFDQRRAAW